MNAQWHRLHCQVLSPLSVVASALIQYLSATSGQFLYVPTAAMTTAFVIKMDSKLEALSCLFGRMIHPPTWLCCKISVSQSVCDQTGVTIVCAAPCFTHSLLRLLCFEYETVNVILPSQGDTGQKRGPVWGPGTLYLSRRFAVCPVVCEKKNCGVLRLAGVSLTLCSHRTHHLRWWDLWNVGSK